MVRVVVRWRARRSLPWCWCCERSVPLQSTSAKPGLTSRTTQPLGLNLIKSGTPPHAACRGESSREGRLLLPKQQAALLDLAAAALFHASGVAVEAAPEGGLQEDDFEFHKAARARKRRRLAPLLSRLAERVGTAPALWAPVLARLLLCYGLALPAGAYVLWLRRLAEVAPRHCPQHFMSDEHDADSALWVLRLAHALALAWPLHLTLRGGGGGGRGGGRGGLQEEGLPPPAAVAEQWMVGVHGGRDATELVGKEPRWVGLYVR